MIDKSAEKKLEEILTKHSDLWNTKSKYLSFIRGGIRRGCWEKHPVKLQIIQERRVQIPNPNPRGNKPTVWGCKCEICEGLFKQSDIQVDHIRSHFSKFTDINDIQQFVIDMVMVTKDDLRLVCKECHEVVSLSQKDSVTFDEARLKKEYIHICKDKKLLVAKLKEFGVESIPKTLKAQKELLSDLMLNLGEHND